MTHRRGRVLGATLVALAAVAPAAGQQVRGTLMAADHDRPVAGALVVLYHTDATPVDSARTDSAGRFTLHATRPGEHRLHIELEGFLTLTEFLTLERGETVDRRIEIPLISAAAAVNIRDIIEREDALQLPLDELCREALRPWEAGLLVGMVRDRRTNEPVPAARLRVTPVPAAAVEAGEGREQEPAARRGAATSAGVYWFCNLPPGRVRLVARQDGFRPDTSYATIRAGTVSWYDVLLRRAGP